MAFVGWSRCRRHYRIRVFAARRGLPRPARVRVSRCGSLALRSGTRLVSRFLTHMSAKRGPVWGGSQWLGLAAVRFASSFEVFLLSKPMLSLNVGSREWSAPRVIDDGREVVWLRSLQRAERGTLLLG
jgi:hypothetical protein